MKKRGQTSIFVIIGIIVIILILLFIFLRERVYIGPSKPENLEAQFPQIQEHIEECLIEISEPQIELIGLQGGYIDVPDNTYRRYQGDKIAYLCYNIADQPYCRSRVLRLQDMEQELAEKIKQDLQVQCLNLGAFNKIGYDLREGELGIDVEIGQDGVLITADLPITIARGAARAEQDTFSITINAPLGRLYDASRDIVKAESLIGNFDTLTYSLAKTQLTSQLYVIQKLQPYPDKLYILKIKDKPSEEEPYIFQFFIQGEPR